MPTASPAKNLRIESLRAIAILMVMAQHMNGRLPMPRFYAPMLRHLQFWPGVDLFFAISGYLICGNFLRLMLGSPSKFAALRKFAQRRFWRLMPALLFWMAFSVLLAAFIGNAREASESALAALAGVSNFFWHDCLRTGTSTCGSLDFNSVAWSLSLEFQLYALISLLLVLLRPPLAIAVLLVLGLIACCFPPTLFSLPWLLRPTAFALGALASQLSWPARPIWLDRTLLAAGVILAVTAPRQLPPSLVLGATALAGVLCLISCLGQSRPAAPVLVWIGERSYSLYLCHLPMILLTRSLGLPWFAAPVIALAAAHGSFTFIEQRTRRR